MDSHETFKWIRYFTFAGMAAYCVALSAMIMFSFYGWVVMEEPPILVRVICPAGVLWGSLMFKDIILAIRAVGSVLEVMGEDYNEHYSNHT